MRISLRANEKIYINGAVFSVDRRVSLILMNDATFLLQAHVMQKEAATTPLRRIYFSIQAMLIDPPCADEMRNVVDGLFAMFARTTLDERLVADANAAQAQVRAGRMIDALKALRALFAAEDEQMRREAGPRFEEDRQDASHQFDRRPDADGREHFERGGRRRA